jgi:hypothetical protein
MDPKAAQAHAMFMQAMQELNAQYVAVLRRMGVKRIQLYRF